MMAILVPTGTSIYWLCSNTHTNKINFHLFSISCLLLDLKFFFFLHVFESLGYYIRISVVVWKRIMIVFFGLFLTLVSFAHAFHILLEPRQSYSLDEPPPMDDYDRNNPWVLTSEYNQELENGTILSNSSFVQKPDNNTNMFADFKTSLLSTYLYLLGMVRLVFESFHHDS